MANGPDPLGLHKSGRKVEVGRKNVIRSVRSLVCTEKCTQNVCVDIDLATNITGKIMLSNLPKIA